MISSVERVTPLMMKITHTKAALKKLQSPNLTSPSTFPGAWKKDKIQHSVAGGLPSRVASLPESQDPPKMRSQTLRGEHSSDRRLYSHLWDCTRREGQVSVYVCVKVTCTIRTPGSPRYGVHVLCITVIGVLRSIWSRTKYVDRVPRLWSSRRHLFSSSNRKNTDGSDLTEVLQPRGCSSGRQRRQF